MVLDLQNIHLQIKCGLDGVMGHTGNKNTFIRFCFEPFPSIVHIKVGCLAHYNRGFYDGDVE